MEFPKENIYGPKDAIPPKNSSDLQGPSSVKWSNEFQCYTVNGILCPIPLSAIPMDVVANDEELASSSQNELNRKKRKNKGDAELFFKLFKFPNVVEQYLLETHEVQTGGIIRQHVTVSERNGKWKVGINDLALSDHVVIPVLQDPTPPICHKTYQLPLEERLVGWTVEKRKRDNGKEDKATSPSAIASMLDRGVQRMPYHILSMHLCNCIKRCRKYCRVSVEDLNHHNCFYYHQAKQFRSFVEVTTFIIYSCKVKELHIISTNTTFGQVLEAETAEDI